MFIDIYLFNFSVSTCTTPVTVRDDVVLTNPSNRNRNIGASVS